MLEFEFRTKRLWVRPLEPADYEACVRTRRLSQLSTAELEGGSLAVSLSNRAEFGRMTDHRLDQMLEDRSYRFGVFVARTGEFIGEVMLFDVLRGNRQMASIGAIVHTAYRRQGYASEALRGLIRFGFRRLHLHRIEGQARPENAVSIHMCKSVGFHEEGISVGRFKEGGRWFDALILAMVRRRKR